MRFGLLGPVTAVNEDGPIKLGATLPRTVLAVLLLNANTVVSTDQLVEALWGDRPPPSSGASLYNHVMRLRRMLGQPGGERIRAVPPGYLIQLDAGELDLQEFSELCTRGTVAMREQQWEQAYEDLSGALALWRGEPLSDVPDSGLRDAQIQRLLESRLQALEGRIEAELALGRHNEAVSELRALTLQHPMREAFHAQLMLALYRSGRQDEALDAFQRLRSTLIDELGAEPSAALQRLHHRILCADSALAVSSTRSAANGGGSGLRSQLPADTRAFTGRAKELDRLADLAPSATRGEAVAVVVICAIDGMAGIGKTTLAIHAARRMRERFPDGQLFVDLHGHTPGIPPVEPGDALDFLLRSLGVPPHSIPKGVAERAAFYRDRLSGSRTLVLLDNVASTAQIRPLLPGDPGCMVIATSRKRLTGLDDADTIALDILPESDAIALLRKTAGAEHVLQDDPAVAELVALCGYVPLAVRIAAARLRHRSTLRVEDLVRRLRDENTRLGYLQDDDRSLAAVFDLSYQQLPSAERLLLRRLSLIPGPDTDAYAVANLIDTDLGTARRLLESLVDHHLLNHPAPGRYRFHDLIRLYARGLPDDGADGADDAEAAATRLYAYYEHTAHAADRHIVRYHRPLVSPRGPAPAVAPDLPDRAAAMAWMGDERDNLLVAVRDQPSRVITLSASLASALVREFRHQQAFAVHSTIATAAHSLGEHLVEANALHDLARARYDVGDYAAAADAHEEALAVYRMLGERRGEANALHDLGRVRFQMGEYPAATDAQERALTLYRALGERLHEANTLHELARVREGMCHYLAAAALHEEVIELYRSVGDWLGEANTLHDLGRIRLLTGERHSAIEMYERALAMFREHRIRQGEANMLFELGLARNAAGDHAAAADLHERALAVFQEVGLRPGEAYALYGLGQVRHATGDFLAAADLQERALEIFRELGDRQGEASARHELGRARYASAAPSAAAAAAAAAELYESALTIFRDIGDRNGATEVLNSTAGLVAETTGPTEARALYREALRIARELNNLMNQARALEGSARCAMRTGDREAALDELQEAVELYERTGAAEAADAAALLADLRKQPQTAAK